jgi:UDP-hydrolysing UDP-N-acetyl-D-glucosamine 2-epimerase
MGEDPAAVHITGCPSIDLAKEAILHPLDEADVFSAYGGVGPRFDLAKGYIIVLQHPVTTEYHEARNQIDETLHAVRELGQPTLWFWPNVDAGSDGTSKGIRAFREIHNLPHVHFFKNLPPEEFIRVVNKSLCIVGNSSVAIRECSYLGVPAVNIGSRQLGRDRGQNVFDVDHDRHQIVNAVRTLLDRPRPRRDHIYGSGEAGKAIAAVLASVPLTFEKRLSYG